MKNLAASVKARLLNIARDENQDFNRVLLLYMQERFLARLAMSEYKERFVLKGGVYMYLRYGSRARSTVDLDLLGRALPADLDLMADIVRTVAVIPSEDGVRFDADSVMASRIREGANYEGVRVKLTAYLEAARVALQIDVGFGDALINTPEELTYLALLTSNSPPPSVLAYGIETVVAEKFQAMVVLGTLNSRLKDFYDIYIIAQREPLEAVMLTEALRATFERRGTSLKDASYLFEADFGATPSLQQGWKRFCTANPSLNAPEDFAEVVARVAAFLKPVSEGVASGVWQPESAVWK